MKPMSEIETLTEQIRKYISEHPSSDAVPLFKEILDAFAHGTDPAIFVRLCASCQSRVQAFIEETEGEL